MCSCRNSSGEERAELLLIQNFVSRRTGTTNQKICARNRSFYIPEKDVPAPDVNTDGQIMAWIADEYSKITGKNTLGVVTGKPLSVGGSLGRDKATAKGGVYVLEEVMKEKNLIRKRQRL